MVLSLVYNCKHWFCCLMNINMCMCLLHYAYITCLVNRSSLVLILLDIDSVNSPFPLKQPNTEKKHIQKHSWHLCGEPF